MSKIRAGCILINNQGEILIVHNISSDFWGFPKGHKYASETHIQAAMRELYEEAGKILNPDTIVTCFDSTKSKLYLAVGDFERKCVVDGWEIDAYKWTTLPELKKLKTSKFTQAFFNRIDNTLRVLEIDGKIKYIEN